MKPQRTQLAQLLGELHAAGLSITVKDVNGQRICCTPKRKLSPTLVEGIQRFREEILELLAKHGDRLLPLFAFPLEMPEWVKEHQAKSAPIPLGSYPTANQCSQCSAWRLSVFVSLSWTESCYLCEDCLARHEGQVTQPAGGVA